MRNESSSLSSSTVEWWWWGRWKKFLLFLWANEILLNFLLFSCACCSFVHEKMVFCWWKYRTWPFTQNTGTTTALTASTQQCGNKDEKWKLAKVLFMSRAKRVELWEQLGIAILMRSRKRGRGWKRSRNRNFTYQDWGFKLFYLLLQFLSTAVVSYSWALYSATKKKL